jgi:ring-1,2-phenylacetyl-CoA epoxidase subunit PaaC
MAFEDYSKKPLLEYTLRLADTTLILGHRLSEWCGHGPVLEQDIAITNIALDLVGQARMYYQYAGEIEGQGRDEDDLAYHRDEMDFRHPFLVEQPNGHWGTTLMRQCLFDTFHQLFLQEMAAHSSDTHLQGIANKSLKEVNYHAKYSSEWVVRLGQGTSESHEKMQNALESLWKYSGELVTPDEVDENAVNEGFGVDIDALRPHYYDRLSNILERAGLTPPENTHMHTGGKGVVHSEHLGYILAEMQSVQRAHPGLTW